jgi:photosystem II stability/assembly factor-like uncharacterized protein
MRKYILYVLLLYAASTQAQQWYARSITTSRDVNAVYIRNPHNIFIAGGHISNDSIQSLYRTDGYYWSNTLDISTNRGMLLDMTFTDSLHGYACGYNGNIIRSTDGGQTWTLIPTPITGRNYRKLAFINALKGFAVGSDSRDSIETIITTNDAGATWSTVIDQPGLGLNAITFINTDTGFAIGDMGVVLSTVNGGNTWTSVTSPLVSNFTGIKFINADTGFIVGGDDSTRVILNTSNGGASWNILKNETGHLLTDIAFTPSKGYIVGYGSSLLTSTDGGQTWAPDTVSIFGNSSLTSVKFFSDSFGMIGALGGYVFYYTRAALSTTYTLGSTVIDSADVSLTMNVNTNGSPGQYYFAITSDSTLANLNYSPYMPINTRSAETHSQVISGLGTNTRYYYFAACATLAGISTGDTLQFYTGTPYSIFSTLQASATTSSSATLNGLVDRYVSSVTLDFEYGTTPALGSVIIASPSTVNDTSAYSITASLTGLLSDTTYYFRLRGHTSSGYEYGNTSAFYTGAVYTDLTTQPATYITDSSADLNATIDGFITPVSFGFQIGTTPIFDTLIPVLYPASVTDTAAYSIACLVSYPYIQPHTLYFYRLVAYTALGTFYGSTLTFYSGYSFPPVFITLNPTAVTSSTATLEGVVSHFSAALALSFEYGTTPSLGDSVAAIPATINDTGTHQVSATLTVLTANTVYYYRLRGDYQGGTIYGSTKYAYTGNSDIPNWDFQLWNNDTVVLPYYWKVIGDNFARIPGHSGNYAIQINAPNVVLLGAVGDNNGSNSGPAFYGGAAMNARPDSVIAYLRYDFQPGDTGSMMAVAYSGSTYIAQGLYPITGSTGGSWQRVARAIPYMIPGVNPDSIVVGFTPVDIGASGPMNYNPSDYMAIDDISFSSPLPVALPNAGFEQWFTYGYERLVSWPDRFAYIGFNYNTLVNSKEITKAYFNPPNDFAAEVSNIIVDGKFAAGSLSTQPTIFNDSKPCFPVFINHQTFNGFFKFYPVNNDTLTITVTMYQNGQNIGGGQFLATDTVDTFTPFNLMIYYYYLNSIADSASITITPCLYTPRGLSWAVIDKLTFDNYSTTGVDGPSHQKGYKMWAYPNPAATWLTIELAEPSADAEAILTDISGRVVKVLTGLGQGTIFKLDISDISTGLYLLNMHTGSENRVQKILIDR